MVEQAKSDPTVHEIVVALRETATRRNGGGMAAPVERAEEFDREEFDRPAAGRRSEVAIASRQPWGEDSVPSVEFKQAAFADIAELRDAEVQRLLNENRRLNERVVYLIKVIEREQEARAALTAALDRAEAPRAREREAVGLEVRQAIEAELRPVLLTILKLLEKPPAQSSMRRVTSEVSVTSTSVARAGETRKAKVNATPDAGYNSNWILDLIQAADRGADNVPASHTKVEHAVSSPSRHDDNPVARFFHRIKRLRLTTTRYD